MDRQKFTFINNQLGMVGDITVVFAMVVAMGFAGYMVYSANKPQVNARDNVDDASLEEVATPYPEIYRQYELPEYPDTKITVVGNEDSSVEDGINLTIKTADEVAIAGKFYEDAFSKLSGWIYTPPRDTSATLYGAKATKNDEDLTYELTITKFSGSTNIRISFLKNADSAR